MIQLKRILLKNMSCFSKRNDFQNNLRFVDLKILEMNTRTNCSKLSNRMLSFDEVPEERKKMINLKYDIKKMEKALKNEKWYISNLKKKRGIKHYK